ncbi:MAG TPA: glycosyltransferase family 39 protein [Streptosporangiaceae bacterium]|jgi:mannosyltransferase|nr:glycosyltransferase family 39 protein [Streptosporangiaceae bacterium]
MSTAVSEIPIDRLERTAQRRLDWTLVVGPAVTLVMMLWGIGNSAYWGDEADTVSAVSRSVPQLFRMLANIDAVHGLYYLVLWPVAAVAGTGEFATRFPSALAMAATALGVTAIARRLVSRRAGLCAGLVFAFLPTVSAQGQDARPYAMATAAAVLSSYLFVRIIQDPQRRWFVGYGLSLVLLGYLHMFGLLLMAAHVVTLIGLRRRHRGTDSSPFGSVRLWVVTFVAAGVAMAPLLMLGWEQRVAIAWITKPGWVAAVGAAKLLTDGSTVSMVVLGELGVLGILCGARLAPIWPLATEGTAPDGGRLIGWLALPWLVLPPAILLAVSEIMPVYYPRYITYCLPAVALLVGCGLATLRLPVRAVAFALVLALALPAQLALRVPNQGMLVASRFLSAHEKPGDAWVYPLGLIPPWLQAYPEGFSSLRDIGLDQTAAVAGRLYATAVPPAVLKQRELGVQRIWVVGADRYVQSPGGDISSAFHLEHRWALQGHLTVWLYVRGS